MAEAITLPKRMLEALSRAIVGKEDIKEALVVALIAGGHVLIEGHPGTAKTTLVKAFAQLMGGEFKRIQFTPDMMPADITGFYLYSPNGPPRFVQGPIFAHVVLADELNRTTPRTQAAMLEAMQEGQVTIERTTYPLPRPYMLIATQLRSGAEGTYPLTDVQVDRFMLSTWSGHGSAEEEKQVIAGVDYYGQPNLEKLATTEEVIELQEKAKQVFVADSIVAYIQSLLQRLREDPDVQIGPSLRAGIAMFKCSRALALVEGRSFAIPDDVKHLAMASLQHRVRVKPEAEMEDITPTTIIERALEQLPVPRIEM